MMFPITRKLTFVALFAVCVSCALAEETDSKTETPEAQPTKEEQVEARLREFSERLELTEEQQKDVGPMLKTYLEAQQAILAKYGIELERDTGEGEARESLGLRKARALKKELLAERETLVVALEKVLSEAQMKTLKAIQEERQAAMRARLGARRK